MILRYLGHSAFLLEDKYIKGLIDPFLTGNPMASFEESWIQEITHIFVTHGHGDHLGDTLSLAKKNNALIICNFEIGQLLQSEYSNIHTMHIGGSFEFSFGAVKMIPALHGSSLFFNETLMPGGSPCGFLIRTKTATIYHAGDTGLSLEMQLLQEESIDFALLPIGGNYTMDSKDALRAFHFIKPRKVIPMHYNTFPLIQCNAQNFINSLPSEVGILLSPGETLSWSR